MVAKVTSVGQGSSGSSAADNRIGYLRIENRLYRVTVKNATLPSSPETLRKIHLIAHTQLQGISNATKIVIKASTTTIHQQASASERQNTQELKQPSELTHHAYQTLVESNETPITQELYTETYDQYQTSKTCSAVFQSLFRQQDQPPARRSSSPIARQATSSSLEQTGESGSFEEVSGEPASPSLSSAPEPQEGDSRVALSAAASAVDSGTAPSDPPLATSTDAPHAAQQESSVEQSSRQEEAPLASAPPRSSTPAASTAGDAPASAPAPAAPATASVVSATSGSDVVQENCKRLLNTAMMRLIDLTTFKQARQKSENYLAGLRKRQDELKTLLQGELERMESRGNKGMATFIDAEASRLMDAAREFPSGISEIKRVQPPDVPSSIAIRVAQLMTKGVGTSQDEHELKWIVSNLQRMVEEEKSGCSLVTTNITSVTSALKMAEETLQAMRLWLETARKMGVSPATAAAPASEAPARTATVPEIDFSDELDAPSTTNLGLDPTYGISASHPLTAPQQVPVDRIEPSPPTDSTSSSSSAKPAAPATTTPEAPDHSTVSDAEIEFQGQFNSVLRSLSSAIDSTETSELGLTYPELELAIELIGYKFEGLTVSNLPNTFQAKLAALADRNKELADKITKATTAINLMKLAKSIADLIRESNIKSLTLTNNLQKCQSAMQSYWGERMRRTSDEARPSAPVSSPSIQPLDDEETSSQSSTSSQSKPGASSSTLPTPPSTSGSSSRSSSPLRPESPRPADSSGEVIESTDRAAMIPKSTEGLEGRVQVVPSFRSTAFTNPNLNSARPQLPASPSSQASAASSEESLRPTRAARTDSLVPSPTDSESAGAVIEERPIIQAGSELLGAEAPPAAPESDHSSEPSSSASSSRPSTPSEAQAFSEKEPSSSSSHDYPPPSKQTMRQSTLDRISQTMTKLNDEQDVTNKLYSVNTLLRQLSRLNDDGIPEALLESQKRLQESLEKMKTELSETEARRSVSSFRANPSSPIAAERSQQTTEISQAAPQSAHSSQPSSSVSSSRSSTPIEAQAVSEEKQAPASESALREGSVRSSPAPSPVDSDEEAAAGEEIQLGSSSSSSSSAAATEMVPPVQVRPSSPKKPPLEDKVRRIVARIESEVSELNVDTTNSKYLTDLAKVKGTVENRIKQLGRLRNHVQRTISNSATKEELKRLITESRDRYQDLLGIIAQKKAEIEQRLTEEHTALQFEIAKKREIAIREAEARAAQRAREQAALQLATARADIVKNQQLLNELSRRLEDVIETGTMTLQDGPPLTYTQASKEAWNRILGEFNIRASILQETLAKLHRQVSQSSSPDLSALDSQYELIVDYIGLLLYEGDLKDIAPLKQLESRLETYNDRFTHHGKTDLFRAWETRLSNYHAIIEFIKAYSAEGRSVNVIAAGASVTLQSLDQRYRPTISEIVAQYGLDWLQNPSALKTRILNHYQGSKEEIDRLRRAVGATKHAKHQADLRAANLRKQLAIITLYEEYLAKKTRPPAPAPVASPSASASASAAAPDVVITNPIVAAFIDAYKNTTLYTYIKETNETKTLSNLSNKKAQIKALLQKRDGTWITDLSELAPLKLHIKGQFNECETDLKNQRIGNEAKRNLKAKKDKLIIKLIILDNYIEYLKTPRRTR
jgi:hypothetical protein